MPFLLTASVFKGSWQVSATAFSMKVQDESRQWCLSGDADTAYVTDRLDWLTLQPESKREEGVITPAHTLVTSMIFCISNVDAQMVPPV